MLLPVVAPGEAPKESQKEVNHCARHGTHIEVFHAFHHCAICSLAITLLFPIVEIVNDGSIAVPRPLGQQPPEWPGYAGEVRYESSGYDVLFARGRKPAESFTQIPISAISEWRNHENGPEFLDHSILLL